MRLYLPWVGRERISSFAAFNVFCWLNLIIFFDRGIIPGANREFVEFIIQSTHAKNPDLFLGMLQSFFFVGLIVGSIVFSVTSGKIFGVRRFRLATVAIILWLFSASLSGLSYYAQSYALLICARMLSGFSESCILYVIPNWILSAAPAIHRGTWLGIFYTAIPVGKAIGYTVSAAIASSSLRWPFAYYIEAFMTIPLLIFVAIIVDEDYTDLSKVGLAGLDSPTKQPYENISIYLGILKTFGCPIFMAISLGSAAQGAVVASISTFGSSFLVGLGIYDSEVDASSIMGTTLVLTAIVGIPLGRYVVDYLDSERSISGDHRVYHRRQQYLGAEVQFSETSSEVGEDHAATINVEDGRRSSRASSYPPPMIINPESMVPRKEIDADNDIALRYRQFCAIDRCCAFLYIATLSSFVCFTSLFFAKSKSVFLLLMSLAFGLYYSTGAAIVVGQSVEMTKKYKIVSCEVGLMLLRLLGDIPGPIFGGIIKGTLAPTCVENGHAITCPGHTEGLRWSIFWMGLWSFCALACYFYAWHHCSEHVFRPSRRFVQMLPLKP